MATIGPRPPVQPGEPAPQFTLPAVHQGGIVSLDAYRGQSPVLLAMFRGLYCPFCRRHIAQFGVTREKLRATGVETLAIVATQPERARLYLRFHPSPQPLAADPELVTHQSYGLPNSPMTPEVEKALDKALAPKYAELTRELGPGVALGNTREAVDRADGFTSTPTDHEDLQRHGAQACGQFLVDRDGIVRWASVEGAKEGLDGLGKFPGDDELLAAARGL